MGFSAGSDSPRPISVAHLDTGSAFRGGQEALLNLARALQQRGLPQHLFSPAGSALAERAQAAGIPHTPSGNLKILRRLLRECDIVHSHSGRAQNLAFCVTAGLPVRRAASRHVTFEPKHPHIHRLKYSLTCHGVIAVSEAVRSTLIRAGVAPERIEVIPNGIDWPPEIPPRDRNSGEFIAGHLGAFTREKGQDVAIEAARLLASRLPGLRMILAGEGPLRPAIAPASVVLPGHIENRAGFFAALDLFLMPSRSEAWGLAALEAMAHGIPVIASNTGGLAEMIEPEVTGWLIPPGDPAALADAIERAARDRKALEAMGARAREHARRFTIQETAARTEAFYRKLLDR